MALRICWTCNYFDQGWYFISCSIPVKNLGVTSFKIILKMWPQHYSLNVWFDNNRLSFCYWNSYGIYQIQIVFLDWFPMADSEEQNFDFLRLKVPLDVRYWITTKSKYPKT